MAVEPEQDFFEAAFRYYSIEDTVENREQMKVFMEALQVFAGRDAAYGSVWKQYGALSNLLSVARKNDRLMNMWWHGTPGAGVAFHKDALDDAYDLLNYCVFFIRNARNSNVTGSEPYRQSIRNEALEVLDQYDSDQINWDAARTQLEAVLKDI